MTKTDIRKIPDGWNDTSLAKLMTFSNGRTSPERCLDGSHPVYGANGIIGYSEEVNSEKDTLVVGRVGAYCGSVYFSSIQCWITDNAIRGQAGDNANPNYMFYLLGTLHLNSRAGGSGHPLLNQSILNAIEVVAPDEPEQKAIAGVLSSLDDKIELLRKQNETLEAIAQTIFKEWFVNFNFPDKNGKPYKDSGGKMIDSELGPIPHGWKVKELGDILTLEYGKALRSDHREHGTIPVIGSNGRVGWHNRHLVSGPGIVVGRKGNPGTVNWVHHDFFPIDTTFYVVAKTESLSLHFLYHALQHQNLPSLEADSAVPGLNRNLPYMNPQIVPSTPVVNTFDSVTKSIFSKILLNKSQGETLTRLRDSLLPKLMSGQVRVKGF